MEQSVFDTQPLGRGAVHWTDGDEPPRVMENGEVGPGAGDKWEADIKAGHQPKLVFVFED